MDIKYVQYENEDDKNQVYQEIGRRISEALFLSKNRSGFFPTSIGNLTEIGLTSLVEEIINISIMEYDIDVYKRNFGESNSEYDKYS